MKKRIQMWLNGTEGQLWLKEKNNQWNNADWKPARTFESWIKKELMYIFCTTAGVVNKLEF